MINTNIKHWMLLAGCLFLVIAGPAKAQQLALPSPEQAAWHDMEIGMFIHFGIETWQDQETDGAPKMEHTQLFDPPHVDTDQWVSVAESMGAKYIVLVAKHHGGFCLWQTDTTEYGIKNSPYKNGKGDIVAEVAESCRKKGMKLGLYISPADFSQKTGGGGRSDDANVQESYSRIYRQQWTELLTRYGDVMELWFDGSTEVKMGDVIRRHAPKAMVFQSPWATIRWVGNESGVAPYPAWNSLPEEAAKTGVATARHGTPRGTAWMPNECDARIRAQWFYRTDNAHTLKSVDELMEMYYRSVGHGAVLLLNNTPDRTGRIPEADAKRSAEFGAEIERRFGRSLAETNGNGTLVELDLGRPTIIDHVVTMENILHGERVREYVAEGLVGREWKPLAEGTAIGHKKIDRFEPVEVSKVRLRIAESAATPMIRKLAVFNTAVARLVDTGPDRKDDWQTAWRWSPDSIQSKWRTVDIDLSSHVPEPMQYEVVFKQTGGANDVEIGSVVLVLDGIEVAGFAEPLDRPRTYNINITATPSRKKGSILLRTRLRGSGGNDTRGQVLIKPRQKLE